MKNTKKFIIIWLGQLISSIDSGCSRAWGVISVLTQIGYVVAYVVCGILADYVFGPMLMENGILAGSVGRIIGTGEGRGIGLMLIITGFIMFAFVLIFGSKKSIKEMEGKLI